MQIRSACQWRKIISLVCQAHRARRPPVHVLRFEKARIGPEARVCRLEAAVFGMSEQRRQIIGLHLTVTWHVSAVRGMLGTLDPHPPQYDSNATH